MMNDRISDLLRIVREEIKLYRDLIEHTRRKTALLAQGRVEAIHESNKVEDTFNVKLRILENEMVRLCSDLAQAFGIPREEFTLMKLADSLEQSLAQEIRSQTVLFRNLVNQLKSVAQRNMRLIERSIYYSRGLLDLLSNATGSYQHTGLFKSVPSVRPTFSQRA
jgi:hypothetical protein